MKKYFNLLLILLFAILEIFVLSKSEIVIDNFVMTINICLYNLMPTLFASILFNNILIKLNIEKYIPKFIKKIFNLSNNEDAIIILSLISGYPNNASMLENSKNVNNIIQYTNFVNPIFLIGTVGGIYLKNIKLAIIILLSQYISNILIGIFIRKRNIITNIDNNKNNISFLKIYYSSIKNTIYTLAVIFANILFFSIVNSLFTNMIHLSEPLNSIFTGIIEFSSGIYKISVTSYSSFIKGLVITLIITFGSFSIHMQIMNINDKINYIKYLIYRILNMIISVIIYLILYYLILS